MYMYSSVIFNRFNFFFSPFTSTARWPVWASAIPTVNTDSQQWLCITKHWRGAESFSSVTCKSHLSTRQLWQQGSGSEADWFVPDVVLNCLTMSPSTTHLRLLLFLTSRQPASRLRWTALRRSAIIDLRQAAASQTASRGRLQMPGPRTNAFPSQATGEGTRQGTGGEIRAAQRSRTSLWPSAALLCILMWSLVADKWTESQWRLLCCVQSWKCF